MDKYYYFVSQLPLLAFGQKTEWDRSRFLEEAGKWVSGMDMAALLKTNIDNFITSKETNKYLRGYQEFEKNLREELAKVRKTTATTGHKELSILNAFNWDRTPLEIEKNLLFLRWQFIEEQEQQHHFDIGFLIYYFLKLHILEVLSSFDKDKGAAIFDSLCEVKG